MNGRWGAVCSDSQEEIDVCSQLGFPTGLKKKEFIVCMNLLSHTAETSTPIGASNNDYERRGYICSSRNCIRSYCESSPRIVWRCQSHQSDCEWFQANEYNNMYDASQYSVLATKRGSLGW